MVVVVEPELGNIVVGSPADYYEPCEQAFVEQHSKLAAVVVVDYPADLDTAETT